MLSISKRKSGLINPTHPTQHLSGIDESSSKDNLQPHLLRKGSSIDSIVDEQYGLPTAVDLRERYGRLNDQLQNISSGFDILFYNKNDI